MSANSRRVRAAPAADPRAPSGFTGSGIGTIGVVGLSMALLWAGTHELGVLYAERPSFSSVRWWGSLALIGAAGFVFANAIRPVDVRAKIDWARVLTLNALPLAFLIYCWIVFEFQFHNGIFNTLLAWASPYGHGALAVMVGIGLTAGIQTKR